jgi:MerR family transcriptional regulator, light-induced transcriptional regulator
MALNGWVDLKTAADELGVHYQTAYRWVREGMLPAVKVGVSYEVAPDALDRLRRRRAAPTRPPRTRPRNWAPHVDRLFDALVLGDELMGRQVVDRLYEGGIEVVDMCEWLFTPALRRIGDHWAKGKLSVGVEHRAAAICTRLLARISTYLRGRPRGVAVVTTVPGEAHELPGTMASMVLRADRWRVHHLGTQLPLVHLAELVQREQAGLVVLSVTNPPALPVSRQFADQLRRELGVRVIVGQPGARLSDLVEQARR